MRLLAVTPGLAAASLAPVSDAIVNICGTPLPAANVLYAGLSPGSAGLYQVNIQLPSLPDGDYTFTVSIGSASSPIGGYLTVKN